MLFVVCSVRMREGEELKAPRHASAAAARDDHVTTRDIVPTLATLLLWLPSIYKYCLTSVTNINPPYYCHYNISLAIPKFAKEIVVN